jgi:hypothetical protein
MATGGSAADLFASAPASGGAGGAKTEKKVFKKRVMLWECDHVAHAVLDPFGRNDFDLKSDADVWKMTREGGASCVFHSNLAAKTDEEGGQDRVGIGISQTAQGMKALIKHLDNEHVGKLLKPELLKLAKDEAGALMPFIEVLDLGKVGFSKQAIGFNAMKKARQDPQPAGKPEAEVQNAARELHKFLVKPVSPLRSFLEIMSGGGVFYVAFCGIKTARAACLYKPINEQDFINAAVARSNKGAPASAAGSSEADALTQHARE